MESSWKLEEVRDTAELDDDEKQEIREAFALFADREGLIDVKNIGNLLSAIEVSLPRSALKSKLHQLEKQERGAASVEEIEALVVEQKGQKLYERKVDAIFAYIAGSSESSIDRAKLGDICRELQIDYASEELDEMITAVDSDSDGLISLKDFKLVLGLVDTDPVSGT